MIAFPNAKVNLGLNIINRRQDGYHDIESVLYPIPWYDVLEIVKADEFKFTQTGLRVEGNDSDNLCVKAYNLLEQEYGLTPVHMHLHKIIPMGAGLGGGSSDASFTLKLLNQIFELDISPQRLQDFASHLGSDCPFFIDNIPAIVTGTGTDMRPVDLNLSEYYIQVIHPQVHVSTAEAYAGVTPKSPEFQLSELLDKDPNTWKDRVINDFETSIFPKHPKLSDLKTNLYNNGAEYAAMSGSGSAVFGLFQDEPSPIEGYEHQMVAKLQLH